MSADLERMVAKLATQVDRNQEVLEKLVWWVNDIQDEPWSSRRDEILALISNTESSRD